MESSKTTISLSIDIALAPMVAFDVFVEELAAALIQQGMSLETGPNGRVIQNEFAVGRVLSWERGELIRLQWRQASWQTDERTDVEIRLEPVDSGTRVTISHRGWGGLIGHPGELAGWFAGEVVAPFLRATAPLALGDWLTDGVARRPSGAQARAVYRDPLYHYPNFYVILSELALTSDDYLIELARRT